MENRIFDYDVLPEIQNHWSPRAFDPDRPVAEDDLMALFEAARYAPSCFNEQPWRFIVAQTPEDHALLCSVLSASNQEWAFKAPVLLLILSSQNFVYNGKPNRWHQFDAGTAWGYLTLEAQHRGLITHGMSGFNVDRAREVFHVPDDYSIIAAVAVGYYGRKADLSEKDQEREHPSPRKSIEEIIFKW